MKFVILAAGSGVASLDTLRNIPKTLLKAGEKTILDYLLESAAALNATPIVIGGYAIDKIIQQYPDLHYFINTKWEQTSALFSLFQAIDELDDDTLISYSDTLYSQEIFPKLVANKKITLCYDSLWLQRYKGRKQNDNAEKIYEGTDTYCISYQHQPNKKLLGEFSGLIYVPKKHIDHFKTLLTNLISNNAKASLNDLVSSFPKTSLQLVDIRGAWAEVDSKQDVSQFLFKTKADTLKQLQTKLKDSVILDQYTFTVEQFRTEPNSVISNIQTYFQNDLLVVRSSALNEDTFESSQAGNYHSVIGVEKDDTDAIYKAIDEVIKSYEKNGAFGDPKNQILVQPYLQKVTKSGVVLSMDVKNNAPYYIVNYENSSDTEAVTSGNTTQAHTFVCYKNLSSDIEDKDLAKLIKAVKEIEAITSYDALDIEFAIHNDTVYIFQVRPIAIKKNTQKISLEDIDKELTVMRSQLQNAMEENYLLGGEKAYGVMPDWNPAEIIGVNPHPLAFDLYRYLITDTIWEKSRQELGYKDTFNAPGIVSFSHKPYVDIEMSFQSLTPQCLSDHTASKLIRFALAKLRQNPHLDDKVEFDVMITSYDFDFKTKLKELQKAGFTEEERAEIEVSYKQLTTDIINEKTIDIDGELQRLGILHDKTDKILASNLDTITKIYHILEVIKQYGTLPFAKLARCAFIGSIFLRSLKTTGVIDAINYNNFFQSISTVTQNFLHDFKRLHCGDISKKEFLEDYGHLRPNTYEISALNYTQGFDEYFQHSLPQSDTHENKSSYDETPIAQVIQKQISQYELDFDAATLLKFIRKSIAAREQAKFEFTKTLDTVLTLIVEVFAPYRLTKEELSFLHLDDILNNRYFFGGFDMQEMLQKRIKENRLRYALTSAIKLPDLIFSARDIEYFFHPQKKANFITHKTVSASVIHLQLDTPSAEIEGKIVCIENADPGFDWIFSHNIKALVTKYGGVASHMAIRCAEFDLPAVIGCGERLFSQIILADRVLIDPLRQKVELLS